MEDNKFWRFRNAAGGKAELLLYGDISEQSWYGDEATPRQFAEDLAALGDVSEIDVRINSGGGDVFAAQAIGNQLEQHKATVTARIDGLCASAATIVACHCDRTVAANDTTYMIHPIQLGICGYVGAEDLQGYLNALTALRENVLKLYAKKTGREKDELAQWMDETSWWTAQEAKDNGFVDELVDGQDAVQVENRGGVLFVNSVNTKMPVNKAPKSVQNALTAAPAVSRFVNNPAGAPGKTNEEEQDMDIKTVDDLRTAYPELVGQIEQAAAERATNEERTRIKDIEEMALPGSEDLTGEAKFTNPVSAAEYAKAAMKRAKEKGDAYLAGAQKDAANAGKVQTDPTDKETDEFMDAIRGLKKAAK